MSSNISSWWELTLEVPCETADDAAALLMESGAAGVQTIDNEFALPTASSDPSLAPDATPIPSASDRAVLIVSYTETEVDDATALPERARAALAELGLEIPYESFAVRRRSDTDWADRWKRFFRPLRIGNRFWVVPSWERDVETASDDIVLSLDPGMAFGTGQHATTALCLELIEEFLVPLSSTDRESVRMIDVGCGSGILAIGAAKLGMRGILAIDNDPIAVTVAAENAAENDVGKLVECSDAPVSNVAGPFDLVVANILASTLIELAPDLLRITAARGRLVLSGILDYQADEVIAAYLTLATEPGSKLAVEAGSSLRLATRRPQGEWVALVFEKS